MVTDVLVDVIYTRLLGRRGLSTPPAVQYLCLPLVVFRVRVLLCLIMTYMGKSIIIVVVIAVGVVVVVL